MTRKYISSKPKKFQGEFIATDSEWDNSLPDPWISTAFASSTNTTVYFRPDIPQDIKDRLNKTAQELGVKVCYIARNDKTDLLTDFYGGQCRLLIFFSPKDMEYAIGWYRWRDIIEKDKVRQNNNLSGWFGRIQIKDLCGWSGKSSLAKFASSLGVPMMNKDSMDQYKTNMWQGLMEKPEEFLRYAVDDAQSLLKIQTAFIDLFRTIQVDCLGMTDDLWDKDTIPMTCGSLVAKTFEKWLYAQAGDDVDAFEVCVRKLGFLDRDHKKYEKSKSAYLEVMKKYRSIENIKQGLTQGDENLKNLLTGKFIFTGLEGSSVRWFASRSTIDSSCYNALVHGGRCLNENPYEYQLENGLDIDISGCYGESLRSIVYPVGLPTIWSWTPNEKKMTLGDWLDSNLPQLVDGLWSVVVSGKLSFEQDLIFSKLAEVKNIRKAGGKETEKITDDFVMLRKQIENGILNSDLLNICQKVATAAQWAEIRRLTVVTAVAYLKNDRKSSLNEWCQEVLQSRGIMKSWKGSTLDKRTRAWYGVPLEGFIGNLVEKRKEAKNSSNDKLLSEEERTRLKSFDNLLKLMINTLYGVFCSPYFPISNTLIANNITARARAGVWMIAKALGLRQCITDGGIYTPAKVCFFNSSRKPGLEVLSRQWDWHNPQRGRKLAPMADVDWSTGDIPSNINDLATDHVKSFWEPYQLTLPFRLEHKTTNTFNRASYWAKADYALETKEGTVYAIRGKNKNKQNDQKRHPTFDILDNINHENDHFPADLTYTKGGILKIGKYKVIQSSNGYENLKDLRPGDNLPVETYTARYNNTHFLIMTKAEYLRRKRRRKIDHGQMVSWFEKHAKKGISGVHQGMIKDNLR